ncbi:hypothetical protein CHS0354_026940 [Potamilus streckersoni]|uniref:TIR domain-containing protein n=1 Tax=Potamilus streckersoni TaxID=2493646 RepID=A0AAE0WAT0_9BIVA|nr:hypothetical protein CHS0354_026940 [Potamilus streckersoni]
MSLLSSQTLFGNESLSVSMESLTFERYIGEGIRLPCRFSYKIPRSDRLSMGMSEIKTTKGMSIIPFFTKDNEDIGNSFKQTVHVSLEEDNDLINYDIKLDIYSLDPFDFGVYRGGLKVVFISDGRCVHKIRRVMELYSCVFNITQVSEYYSYVDVPVGGLLAFKDLFARVVPNEDILHVEHFVNGIAWNDSADTVSKCCLESANVFKSGRDLTISKDSVLSFEITDVYEISGEICVCSFIYGIHRFKLYHHLFDQKNKFRKTLEFWHPHVTVVYPKSSNLLWDTISENEYNLIDKSKKDKNFSLFHGSTFLILQSKMDRDHLIMQYFETFLNWMTFCVLLVSIIYYWGYSMVFVDWTQHLMSEKLGIIVHLQLPEAGGNLADFGSRRDAIATVSDGFVFDVFVSYVEEDRCFIVEELFPFLVKRNQQVCLDHENLPSGPLIANVQQAVRSSKKVIVVVSNSYTCNKIYNDFILPMIILPMLYDGCIPARHLMLLICQPCKIPLPLLADKRIVVLDYSRNPRHIYQKKLHDWLHSSRISERFSLQPVLQAELLQQTQ